MSFYKIKLYRKWNKTCRKTMTVNNDDKTKASHS